MSTGARNLERPFPTELAAVWLLLGLVALAVLVTYSRLPVADLYHVSRSGIDGGASRALVLLNFPFGLIAIPIVVLLLPLLESRPARVVALASIALSAVVFWPGVVTEADLDARPVNALSALGVLGAAALTVVSARGRPRAWAARQRGDRLRVVAAAVTVALALPYFAVELGFSFVRVPVLGSLFLTTELRSQPGVVDVHPAVHLGHHHGTDGVVLVLAALLLSRQVSSVSGRLLRPALEAYLALMACYGVANLANDFWLEQVVKRGWTEWEIPSVLTPAITPAWGLVLVAAAALWISGRWLGRRTEPMTPYGIAGEADA